MKLTQNKLSVILATVVAGVSILANCMTANAAEPMKTRLENRYVLAGSMEETPADGQKVTMIMNNNGTKTIHDDIIEDVLWARPDEVNVD